MIGVDADERFGPLGKGDLVDVFCGEEQWWYQENVVESIKDGNVRIKTQDDEVYEYPLDDVRRSATKKAYKGNDPCAFEVTLTAANVSDDKTTTSGVKPPGEARKTFFLFDETNWHGVVFVEGPYWWDEHGWTIQLMGGQMSKYFPRNGKMDETYESVSEEWQRAWPTEHLPDIIFVRPIYSQEKRILDNKEVTFTYLMQDQMPKLDKLLLSWNSCASYLSADDSRKLGISANWVLARFVADVKEKQLALGAASVCHAEVLDMNFFQASQIAAYGDQAYGKGKLCPRDNMQDCSIVDAVYPDGFSRPANLFLSWVWAFTIGKAMSALWNFMRRHEQESLFVWWCFFQNNQYRILGNKEKQSFEALRNIFGTQVQAVGRMACMMDKVTASVYAQRLWCIFEVVTCVEHNIPMEVMIPEESMEEVEKILKEGFHAVKDSIRIDSEAAKATMPEDEENIKKLIEQGPSYKVVNKIVKRALRQSVLLEIARALDSD